MINESLNIYKKGTWDNFSIFSNFIQNKFAEKKPKVFFDGEGFFEIKSENKLEKYYLFSLNNNLYSSIIINDNFYGIIELDKAILTSDFFPKYHATYYFKKLEASVEVDCKSYDYGKEHKLLISKADKVDLLFSHQLNNVDDSYTLKPQLYNSLIQAVEWQKKVNEINARTAKIVEDMKKK